MRLFPAGRYKWNVAPGNFLTCSYTLVSRLPLNLDGRIARWQLCLWTKKVGKGLLDLRKSKFCNRCRTYDGTFCVVRIGDCSKDNLGLVGFATLTEIFGYPRGLSNADG